MTNLERAEQARINGRKHKHHTEETKRRIGLASIGNKYAAGHVRSEAARQKAGQAITTWNKARAGTEEARLASQKAGRAAKGHRKSAEWRSNLSKARRAHLATHDDACACLGNPGRRPRRQTGIERILLERLLKSYPDVQAEVKFGRYRVDAYVPSIHTAFEADGSFWHDSESDAKRDAWLLRFHNLPVVRFNEHELLVGGG